MMNEDQYLATYRCLQRERVAIAARRACLARRLAVTTVVVGYVSFCVVAYNLGPLEFIGILLIPLTGLGKPLPVQR